MQSLMELKRNWKTTISVFGITKYIGVLKSSFVSGANIFCHFSDTKTDFVIDQCTGWEIMKTYSRDDHHSAHQACASSVFNPMFFTHRLTIFFLSTIDPCSLLNLLLKLFSASSFEAMTCSVKKKPSSMELLPIALNTLHLLPDISVHNFKCLLIQTASWFLFDIFFGWSTERWARQVNKFSLDVSPDSTAHFLYWKLENKTYLWNIFYSYPNVLTSESTLIRPVQGYTQRCTKRPIENRYKQRNKLTLPVQKM